MIETLLMCMWTHVYVPHTHTMSCQPCSQASPCFLSLTVQLPYCKRREAGLGTWLISCSFTNNPLIGSQAVLWTAQSEFGPMKMLSGYIALLCYKYQFCDKMMVSAWTVFKLSLFEQSGCNEERKKWQLYNRTLLHLAVFRVAFEHLCECCWS